MKFAVDAQLPRRLARQLATAGHDALHCLDLPLGNRTPDDDFAALAAKEGRVVVTKDSEAMGTQGGHRTCVRCVERVFSLL
jgi:predicted nuclease of predicted toxin-antitoxin system